MSRLPSLLKSAEAIALAELPRGTPLPARKVGSAQTSSGAKLCPDAVENVSASRQKSANFRAIKQQNLEWFIFIFYLIVNQLKLRIKKCT
jgi:hypothetical protein